MIVQRGFPAPPDYDSPRLRAASADHIFDVITHGYGVMYSYAARVDAGRSLGHRGLCARPADERGCPGLRGSG